MAEEKEEKYSWLNKDRFKKEDEEVLVCEQCGFDFFEEIKANRFKQGTSGSVSQGLVRMGISDFPIYRCLKCGKIHVSPDDGGSTSRQWQLYRKLADAVDPVDPNQLPPEQPRE